MPTVATLLETLSGTIAWSKAAGWDPVGLQVGDPARSLERIAVCHDVTVGVLRAAQDASVDLLVSYHPLVFEPIRRLAPGAGPSGLAFEAARTGIAVATAHTAFDVAPGGTADALAEALGLASPISFGPLWGEASMKITTFAPPDAIASIATAMSAAGAGEIGGYTGCSHRTSGMGSFLPGPGTAPAVGERGVPSDVAEDRLEMVVAGSRVDRVVAALVAAHPYEEPAYDVTERRGEAGFVGRIGSWSGSLRDLGDLVDERCGGVVRVAGAPDHSIERVAVVPGSGASLLAAAAASGADAMVTGDVKHHDARAAIASGLGVVDPGHAATERPGVARLYAAVAAVGVETIDLTAVDADPWAN